MVQWKITASRTATGCLLGRDCHGRLTELMRTQTYRENFLSGADQGSKTLLICLTYWRPNWESLLAWMALDVHGTIQNDTGSPSFYIPSFIKTCSLDLPALEIRQHEALVTACWDISCAHTFFNVVDNKLKCTRNQLHKYTYTCSWCCSVLCAELFSGLIITSFLIQSDYTTHDS